MARQKLVEKWEGAEEIQLNTVLDLRLSDTTVYRFGRLVITSVRLHDVGLVGAKEPIPAPSEPASDTEALQLASELTNLGLPTSFGKKGGNAYRDGRRPAASTFNSTRFAQKGNRQSRNQKVVGGGAVNGSAGVADGVPSGGDTPWVQCYDEQYGCHYYYNTLTQESVWEAPAEGYVPWDASTDAVMEVETGTSCSAQDAGACEAVAVGESHGAEWTGSAAESSGAATEPQSTSAAATARAAAPLSARQPPRMLTEEDLLRSMGLWQDATGGAEKDQASRSSASCAAAAVMVDVSSGNPTIQVVEEGVEKSGRQGAEAGVSEPDGAKGAFLRDLLRNPASQQPVSPQLQPQQRSLPATALSEDQLLAMLGAAVPSLEQSMPPPPPAPLLPAPSPPPPLPVPAPAPSKPAPARMLTEDDILRSMGLLPGPSEPQQQPQAAKDGSLHPHSHAAASAPCNSSSSSSTPPASRPAAAAPAPPPGFAGPKAQAAQAQPQTAVGSAQPGSSAQQLQGVPPSSPLEPQPNASHPHQHPQGHHAAELPLHPYPRPPPPPEQLLSAAPPMPLTPPGPHPHHVAGPYHQPPGTPMSDPATPRPGPPPGFPGYPHPPHSLPHGPQHGYPPFPGSGHPAGSPTHPAAASRPPPGFEPSLLPPHPPHMWPHGAPPAPGGAYGLPPSPMGRPPMPMPPPPPGFGMGPPVGLPMPYGMSPPYPHDPHHHHPYPPYGPPPPPYVYGPCPMPPGGAPPPPMLPFAGAPMHPPQPYPYQGPFDGPAQPPYPQYSHEQHPHGYLPGQQGNSQQVEPLPASGPVAADPERAELPVRQANGGPAATEASASSSNGSAACKAGAADAGRKSVTWTLEELERQFESMAVAASACEAAAELGVDSAQAVASVEDAIRHDPDVDEGALPGAELRGRGGKAQGSSRQRQRRNSASRADRGKAAQGAAQPADGNAEDDDASFYDTFAGGSRAARGQQLAQAPMPGLKPAVGEDDGTRRVTLDPNTAAYVRTLLPRSAAKYWMQRYSLFSRFDSVVQLDTEGWWSVTPEVLAAHQAVRSRGLSTRGLVALDACCGCGGNVIQMARVFPVVMGVEISERRVEMARHNAGVYEVSHKCQFLCADFFQVAPELKVDVLFMSPPWGGPKYQHVNTFDVFFPLVGFNQSLFRLLDTTLDCVRGQDGVVAAFLPRNTDLAQ
ncbi:hypothetical protein Agub_g8718, partial [Astrephomene gubernaculifera]